MATLQSHPLGRDLSINKDQASMKLGDLHMTRGGVPLSQSWGLKDSDGRSSAENTS